MCFGQHLSHVCWSVARILPNETHSSSWYHHIREFFMFIHLFVFILSNLVGFARLLMRTVEINARLMCLCYSVLQVPLYYIVEWNRELLGLKERRVENGKFISWKKLSCYTHACRVALRIYWIASSSSRFAWFELLMNQLGRKMSLTQGIETHVSLSK